MKFLLRLLCCLLFSISVQAVDRITLTVTITNTPSDGNTLVVNSDTRTWKTSVTTPASQVVIGASIGANATNLYAHIAANPYSGPLTLLRSGTNAIQLVGTVGGALSASITGTWASLSYATNTVTTNFVVRVPISTEPTSARRTDIADGLISGIFNSGYASTTVNANSAAMANFVDTSENQTVAGVKTFTGANVYTNASQVFGGGAVVSAELRKAFLQYYTSGDTNRGTLWFKDQNGDRVYSIGPDNTGKPSLWLTYAGEAIGTAADYTPSNESILNAKIGDYRYGQLAVANSWTALNTFTRITNSTIIGSTLTNNTYYGTVGTLTNGTFIAPVLTNAVNKGASFQSYYSADTTTLQLGNGATGSGANSVALGKSATASGAQSIALGKDATATHDDAVAIGAATTTAASEIRIGGSAQNVAAPGAVYVGGNLVIGHANSPTLPTGLAKGLYLTNGTAASADPANGSSVWVASGELQYRSSASSEGAGQVNRVHNRSSQVIGSGSNYSLTGSYARLDFGGQDAEVALPTAGTYYVRALIEVVNGATANDVYSSKLYNSTDSADVTSSERTISCLPASQTGQLVLENVITVTASKVIQIYSVNSTAARGTISSARTSILYIRLF